jgi:undecaprenyl-diphosphatase
VNDAIHRWFPAPALRTIILFAIATVSSVAFMIIADEVHEGDADHLDAVVALAVHRFDSPIGDAIMKAASFIGSYTVVIPIVILTAVLAIHAHKRRAAVILTIDAVVVMTANWLLKLYFSRQRPALFDKVPLPKSFSFPSGHSMCAVGIYGVVAAVLITLYPRSRSLVIAVTILLALMIGLSRVYLGVHWPLDVVAGFISGVPPLVVAVYLLHRAYGVPRASARETTSRPQ